MKIPSTLLNVRTTITPDDKADALTITAWTTLAVLVIMFLAREAIKFTTLRRFALDDLLILFATIFAIGLSVTLLLLASRGLGIYEVLTQRRANALQKGIYASEILYIASLGLAKLSLVAPLYGIHIQRAQRRFILYFGIFLLAWTLASLVAVAFQCGFPKPWETFTLHCYNSGAFWIVYCIIDMTTDVSIIMLSVNLIAYLKVRLSRKVAVIACFAPRVLVIGASLARLIYLYPITPHDSPAFSLWVPAICTQVQVCLSITTACIPYMKPFFESSESGIWRAGSLRKRATIDDSYGCSSLTGCLIGHKRGMQGNSMDSTAAASLKYTRTPDVSPRIPSPRPLSPLTPPRLITPPNSTVASSRSPSERGLRLHIPSSPAVHARKPSDRTTPQTASSHALSPECISPHPLLSPPAFHSSPTRREREPSPPPRSHSPRPQVSSSYYGSPDPNTPSSRFSLFPQRRTPRYSLIPQQYANPQPAIPATIVEHSRSSSQTQTQHTSVRHHRRTSSTTTPETWVPSLPRHEARAPHPHAPSLATTPYEDPMRTIPIAVTTTAPVPMPTPARQDSLPSYYVRTPPTAHGSSFSSPQTLPSYYISTPPSSQPPTFPLPEPPAPANHQHYHHHQQQQQQQQQYYSHSHPHAHYRHRSSDVAAPPLPPTSPQRQRNQRVLTPRNSSRRDQMQMSSPVSPVSPRTPLTFWRDESSNDGRRAAVPQYLQHWPVGGREEVVIRDVRSSPRIVVQSE